MTKGLLLGVGGPWRKMIEKKGTREGKKEEGTWPPFHPENLTAWQDSQGALQSVLLERGRVEA